MKKLLLSAAVASLSVPSFAQSSKVEETIVTATRVEQPLHKALASVSVFTRTDIVNSPALSLPELLGRLPGVDFSTSGGRGSTSSLYIRGTNSKHVLVLVDGVRSASATNGATDLQRIPLDQIERIEVVRGPRSSLYGAEAIGGVIQVFTRQPEGGSVSAEVGSYDSRKLSVSYGGGDITKYKITAGHEKTSGFDNTDTHGVVDDDSDGYEEVSLKLAISHKLENGWMLAASGSIVDSTNEFDSNADDYTDAINQSLIASLKGEIVKDLTLSLEVGQYKDEAENFGSNYSVFDTKRESAQGQLNYLMVPEHTLTLGYDYFNDEVESTTIFDESSRYNKAYFAQYQGGLGDVSIAASFRHDKNEAFGNKDTHSLSAGYNFTETGLVAISYGTAFKAPTFNDLYFPLTDYGFGFVYQGNLDLEPEESETTEILIREEWRGIELSASYYETNVQNLIEFQFGLPSTVNNISQVKVKGGEFSASLSIGGWDVKTSLSYTDPRNKATNKLIDNRSREKASISLNKELGDFDLGIYWITQSHRFSNTGQRLAGYNTVDLGLSYDVNKDLELLLKINNVFDNDYVINDRTATINYETPRANFSLAARYQFGR